MQSVGSLSAQGEHSSTPLQRVRAPRALPGVVLRSQETKAQGVRQRQLGTEDGDLFSEFLSSGICYFTKEEFSAFPRSTLHLFPATDLKDE